MYYDETGKIEYERYWANGEKEGIEILYHEKNGKPKSECNWVKGKIDGKEI